MSDRCSILYRKHDLQTQRLDSNLPLLTCSRCHRVWEYNGAERKYFKMGALQNPEWSVGFITLNYEELNPVLIEYFIKFNGIEDKGKLVELRKWARETKFSIANQLFKS